MNPEAVEHHLKLVLIQWIVIMAVAWCFGRLGQRFGQPLAVGEIFGGLLLGPSALGLVWPDALRTLFPPETNQSLQLLAKLGLILLMFQVGMEFDYGHLRTRSRTVVAVSLAGMLAPMLLGLAIGPWLHREFAPEANRFGFQLFVCIALSISALPIMGRILLEMRLERTALGAIAVSSAALDDVAGWILLAGATALVTAKFAWGALLWQVAGVLIFFLILLWLVGPALRRFWRCSFCLPPEDPGGKSAGRLLACTLGWKSPRRAGADCAGGAGCGLSPQPPSVTHVPATFLAVVLVALFGCAVTTNALGIFSIFGAFLLGVAIHQEVTLVKAWRERFRDFVLVALVPIFFTNTGLRTEIGSLDDARGLAGLRPGAGSGNGRQARRVLPGRAPDRATRPRRGERGRTHEHAGVDGIGGDQRGLRSRSAVPAAVHHVRDHGAPHHGHDRAAVALVVARGTAGRAAALGSTLSGSDGPTSRLSRPSLRVFCPSCKKLSLRSSRSSP